MIIDITATPAGRTLMLAIVLWLLIFATCKQLLWRDPHAAFFSEDGVYDLGYSLNRQLRAHEFIGLASTDSSTLSRKGSTSSPVLCAAITTFNRPGRQYLNETIGSMLADLTIEERSALDVRLLFAHADSKLHPDWNKTWLSILDDWSGYKVAREELGHIEELEQTQNFYEKGVYDYIYVLRQCLTETDAPYVAIFEDDIIFAEGWLAKTLNGLAGLRELSESWLYLRLFYTETSLGWEASSDFWYGHQLLTFTLAMVAALTLLLGAKSTIRSLSRRLDNQMLVILVFIVTPAFTALIFMVGKYNLRPLQGLERMDKHGCCTQALVFPRFQVDDLIDFLYERGSGQTDSLIEEYADLQSYERYALAPQVVQHVGLVSSRNNLAINTKSTWAFWFEAQDARKLRKEHRQMARLGIWRASGDGS
jgi:GR25 family glycosyltransferase involved in LPS biosynthesis